MKYKTVSTRELLLFWPAPLMVPEGTDSVGIEVPLPTDNGGEWTEIYIVGSPKLLGTYENKNLNTISLYYRLEPGQGIYARWGDGLGHQGERRTLYKKGFFCPA